MIFDCSLRFPLLRCLVTRVVLSVLSVGFGSEVSKADTIYASVYDASTGTGQILKFVDTGGTPTVTVFASGLEQPEGMAFDTNHNLCVLDGYTIYKYDADGNRSVFASSDPSSLGGIDGQPFSGLAVDASGNVYVPGLDMAGGPYSRVFVYNSSGDFTRSFGVASGDLANGMTFDAAGNLYVAHNFNINGISEVTPTGVESVVAEGGYANQFVGLAFNAAGSLFVSSYKNVYEVGADGSLMTYASFSKGTAGGIAFDSSGNLFTAVAGNNSSAAIYITTTDGTTSKYAQLTSATSPNFLAIDITAVPEPAEWGVALGGGLLVIVLVRRRSCSGGQRYFASSKRDGFRNDRNEVVEEGMPQARLQPGRYHLPR